MRVAAVLVLAACGRIGFDGSSGGATVDGALPGKVELCNPKTIGTLQLAGVPTHLRAVEIPNGFGVAIGTSTMNVYLARVTSGLTLTSQHLPLADSYRLAGLSAIGSSVFVHAVTNGESYLKGLDPSWDTYATIGNGDIADADPPIAPRNAGTGLWVGLSAGTAVVRELQSDGATTGVTGDYSPAATHASIVRSGDGARVAIATSASTCETFVVGANGATTLRHVPPGPCAAPQIGTLDNGTGVMLWSSALGIEETYVIPSESQTGTQRQMRGVTDGRMSTDGGGVWVLHKRGSASELVRYDATLASTSALVAVESPYDLRGDLVFWVEGTALRVATACLR